MDLSGDYALASQWKPFLKQTVEKKGKESCAFLRLFWHIFYMWVKWKTYVIKTCI